MGPEEPPPPPGEHEERTRVPLAPCNKWLLLLLQLPPPCWPLSKLPEVLLLLPLCLLLILPSLSLTIWWWLWFATVVVVVEDDDEPVVVVAASTAPLLLLPLLFVVRLSLEKSFRFKCNISRRLTTKPEVRVTSKRAHTVQLLLIISHSSQDAEGPYWKGWSRKIGKKKFQNSILRKNTKILSINHHKNTNLIKCSMRIVCKKANWGIIYCWINNLRYSGSPFACPDMINVYFFMGSTSWL